MQLQTIHSYLVHPEKGSETSSAVRWAKITDDDKLRRMLESIFDVALAQCPHRILFTPNSSGEQKNACRDLILRYIATPSPRNGLRIAERLQGVTTKRSGLGLFFLMIGKSGKRTRLVLSRFPAESGILADDSQEDLTIEFIERIFMKKATAYKSAVYEGSAPTDFWTGSAIDRQVNADIEISKYWIGEFLLSDFAVAGALGSQNFAKAVREAANQTTDDNVKRELMGAAMILPGFDGQIVSAKSLVKSLHLSDKTVAALRANLKKEAMF